jgi:hypothetical protein
MKINLKTDKKDLITEVILSENMKNEDQAFFDKYMESCINNSKMYTDTSKMNDFDTKYACKMYYKKNKAELTQSKE